MAKPSKAKEVKSTDKKIKKVKSEDQKTQKGGLMQDSDGPRYSGC